MFEGPGRPRRHRWPPGCPETPVAAGNIGGPRVVWRPRWRQAELKLHKNRQITTSFGFESDSKLWVSVERKLFPQFTPIAWNCSAWTGARACMNLAKNEQNHRSGVPVGVRVTSVRRSIGGSRRRACGGRARVPIGERAAADRRFPSAFGRQVRGGRSKSARNPHRQFGTLVDKIGIVILFWEKASIMTGTFLTNLLWITMGTRDER